MKKKVKLAIYDSDYRADVGYYPVSDSGDKIRVVSGGEGHFMPSFDNDSYIDMPKKFLFWTTGYERTYFAQKLAKSCMNFKTKSFEGPDPEQLKASVAAALVDKLGQEKPAFPPIIIYIMLLMIVGIALKVFGVVA